MTSDLTPSPGDGAPARIGTRELVDDFLGGLDPNTLRSYAASLAVVAEWMGVATAADVARRLIEGGQGGANLLMLRFRNHLSKDRGLKSNSIATRLNAVRGLLKVARLAGLIDWRLEVRVRTRTYRDTSGPGADGYRAILAGVTAGDGPAERRDGAILRLLFDLGLRRFEVAGLDVVHVNWARRTLMVLRKKREDREPMTLPEPTIAALAAWVEVRPPGTGALFVGLSRANAGGRLDEGSIYRIIRHRAAAVGIETSPHRLRHAAITEALNVTNGDVRSVQKFSGHANPATVLIYDDNRRDAQGDIAKRIAQG